MELEEAGSVDEGTRERKITYKDYVPLWENLLDVEQQKVSWNRAFVHPKCFIEFSHFSALCP
jgi:hypothetical protein